MQRKSDRDIVSGFQKVEWNLKTQNQPGGTGGQEGSMQVADSAFMAVPSVSRRRFQHPMDTRT